MMIMEKMPPQMIWFDLIWFRASLLNSARLSFDQAKKYFSRTNAEYRFHPKVDAQAPWAQLDLSNPDTWNQVSYDIHIIAYSNIGSGRNLSCWLCGSELHANFWIRDRWWGGPWCAGDEYDTSKSESDKDDDNDNDSFFQSRPDGDDQFDDNEVVDDFVLQVIGDFQYMKALLRRSLESRLKRCITQISSSREAEDDEDKCIPERSVLATAIVFAKESIHSGKIPMWDGKDEMEEYLSPENLNISDESWHRPQGWACRPPNRREDGMYGKAYLVGRYTEDVAEVFE
jgi:hypothetical protein